MKVKFKRFMKRFVIVLTVSLLLCLSLVSVSSAYTVEGTEYREYSNFSFLSFSFDELVSSNNGVEEWTTIEDEQISKVRYRLTSDGHLGVDVFFNEPTLKAENKYHVYLAFSPIGDNAITDRVYYGSFYHSISRYGAYTINEDSISSYRLGVNDKNEAIIDYAWTNSNDFPTVVSEYSLKDSSKVFYHTYYLSYDFVCHSNTGSASSQISFYFYNFNFDSIPFDTFQLQYGWDSPELPNSDNLKESTKLENQITSDTVAGMDKAKELFNNFTIPSWMTNGLLAVTNIFDLFAKIPVFDDLLQFGLVLGVFAFIVGMSVMLFKPSGGGKGGGKRK